MNVLDHTLHRPYPLPSRRSFIKQYWSNLFFVHWPVSHDQIRQLVPKALEIDTYQGKAWIGIVHFILNGIFPKGRHNKSIIPPFLELNIRTYVTYKGKPGVYFIRIHADSWLASKLAKVWYALPYYYHPISMVIDNMTFALFVKNTNGFGNYKGIYTVEDYHFHPNEGDLEHWLTERYCLFNTNKNMTKIYCVNIHHLPWLLQPVTLKEWENNLIHAQDFDFSAHPPLVHFSKRVEALIWNKVKT
ncbi:YqjF family protein [Alkalihalobacillus sp. BA299]|uniref:YqjF family protein n=1 Tax=Alkalihalobacillus sp. BA299 TaxID=2815938 RepID=UPI001AD95FA5|nr:DUF2071 domain-containing protein [Alkalihalobacillus sp. BA299]